jgi:cytochrome c556
MSAQLKPIIMKAIALLTAATLFATASYAADSKDEEVIKEVMKKYHKAPQGQDNIAKKAQDGKATPAEIKELVAAYEKMAKTHPPLGDEASWKAKNTKLVAAIKALDKGEPNAAVQFKEAVSCKACHDVHRPKKN